MRSKNAVLLALLAGDQLDLVALVEIATSDAPLRYALDTEARVWNGETFAATSGFFDDVAEKRTLAFVMPKNWQGASDARLRVFQVLNQAQLAGDDIEWTGEVRTLIPGQEKVTKAATALADAVTDIGADLEGIDDGGGPHVTELVIDHDDPANPLSAGCLVLVTLWRKTVGGAGRAGGVVVFRADLAYAQRPRHERA